MHPTWINGPVGNDADRRMTRTGVRTVLVMVPHVVAGTRLMDLVPLIEADHRIQLVFTVPSTSDSWHGTEAFVRDQEGLVLPWHQAQHHDFDLILAASYRDIDRVRGPVLIIPHGAGSLRSHLRSPATGRTGEPTHGLARENMVRDGRVVPSALVLVHDDELRFLRTSCPEAVPVSTVAGDLCLDRMRASLPYREQYRHALGVGADDALIVVSSTWSPQSVFGQLPALYRRLLDELPRANVRVAAVLHPNVWTVHGRRQVRAWLSDCLDRDLLLIPPEEGWRATMVAADLVLGDHGSTTQYGAAVGADTVLALQHGSDIRPGSPADVLARTVAHLQPGKGLAEQVRHHLAHPADSAAQVMTEQLTSRPGSAARILRTAMYRLLRLPEPARTTPVSPLPLPSPVTADDPSQVGRPR